MKARVTPSTRVTQQTKETSGSSTSAERTRGRPTLGADGSAVVKTITKQARALAVAQRDSEREAGVTDHSETLDARKAKAKALAMKGHDGGAETAAADGTGKTDVAKTPKKQEAEEVRPQPPKDEVKRQDKESKKGRKSTSGGCVFGTNETYADSDINNSASQPRRRAGSRSDNNQKESGEAEGGSGLRNRSEGLPPVNKG